MILVFDLDDTLYQEKTFVQSGFYQVAKYISTKYECNIDLVFKRMNELEKLMGRGRIFNMVLREYGKESNNEVKRCLSIYRNHIPSINLYADAVRCLKRFKYLPKYIVTDGNKNVQWNKIQSLALNKKVIKSYITHRYGRKNAKPSPYCFLKICRSENILPRNVVYIGDNPFKDFVGIKPLGFKTVRILKGTYRNENVKPSFDADISIRSLDELTEKVLRRLLKSNSVVSGLTLTQQLCQRNITEHY